MKAFVLLSLALVLVGCGGYARPDEGMNRAVAAARSASELGADKDPQAQAHLQRANDNITAAKSLMDHDNKRAEHVLLRAEAEAELAVMLAKQATATAEADAAEEKVKKLQSKGSK